MVRRSGLQPISTKGNRRVAVSATRRRETVFKFRTYARLEYRGADIVHVLLKRIFRCYWDGRLRS